jgi:hypothetical protein
VEVAVNFMMKASETRGEIANLKALKANRDKLLDLVQYID